MSGSSTSCQQAVDRLVRGQVGLERLACRGHRHGLQCGVVRTA